MNSSLGDLWHRFQVCVHQNCANQGYIVPSQWSQFKKYYFKTLCEYGFCSGSLLTPASGNKDLIHKHPQNNTAQCVTEHFTNSHRQCRLWIHLIYISVTVARFWKESARLEKSGLDSDSLSTDVCVYTTRLGIRLRVKAIIKMHPINDLMLHPAVFILSFLARKASCSLSPSPSLPLSFSAVFLHVSLSLSLSL